MTVTSSFYRAYSCCARARNAGFSLIELLVVMGIVVAILAMTLPAVSAARQGQAAQATEALVKSITTSMTNYGQNTIGVPLSSGNAKQALLWDFDQTGTSDNLILDGDPERDPDFSSSLRADARAAGYYGPYTMLGLTLPDKHVDRATGRIVDSWNRPLRVAEFPPGSGQLQVWSTGPDGVQDADANGDDIKPWSSSNDR